MTRRRAVWALLAVAAAVLATGVPVWVTGTTSSAVQDVVALQATGSQVAPGVGAGGLVVAAAALALALARRAGVVVAAVVAVLGGALVVVSATAAAGRAETVLASSAADRVGVATVGDVAVTVWPWLAAVLGAGAVLLGVAVVVASRRWQGPSSRHEVGAVAEPDQGTGARPAAEATGSVDPGDAWDALSRGEDPT